MKYSTMFVVFVIAITLGSSRPSAEGATYYNDFDSGIGLHFSTSSSGGLFTIDTDGPDIRISKPADDGTFLPTGWISSRVKSNFLVEGDFSVTVDFTLNDFPFPGTKKLNESIMAVIADNDDFYDIFRYRSGSNRDIAGTWKVPPSQGYGYIFSNLMEGQYRIQRSGSNMTASIAPADSSAFTTLATVNAFLDPVRIQLSAAQGPNQVNYPRPTTPLDISFDNLYIIADGIVPDLSTLVSIDIKPGSDPNSINLGSNGNIPVAIFGTDTFDVTTVDPATIMLADAGVKARGKKGDLMSSFEDVDGDGLLDLLVHIDTQSLVLSDGDVEALLTGETFDGFSISGTDAIRLVGSSGGQHPATFTIEDTPLSAASAVPEPSTLALLGMGAVGLAVFGSRGRRRVL